MYKQAMVINQYNKVLNLPVSVSLCRDTEHRTVCAAAAAAVSVCCSTVALDGPAGSQKNLCPSVHLPQLQLGSILNNRSVE